MVYKLEGRVWGEFVGLLDRLCVLCEEMDGFGGVVDYFDGFVFRDFINSMFGSVKRLIRILWKFFGFCGEW